MDDFTRGWLASTIAWVLVDLVPKAWSATRRLMAGPVRCSECGGVLDGNTEGVWREVSIQGKVLGRWHLRCLSDEQLKEKIRQALP